MRAGYRRSLGAPPTGTEHESDGPAVTDAKQKLIYRPVKRQSSIFGRQSAVAIAVSVAL